MNDKPSAIIMDLDGTLCDGREYLRLGDHAYHEACTTVAPVDPEMKQVCIDAADAGAMVVILTGRSVLWQNAGVNWLIGHGVPFHVFESRPRGDYRSNAEFKTEVARKLERRYRILRAYDDDPRNLRAFEALGIHAVQVGDFDWRLA